MHRPLLWYTKYLVFRCGIYVVAIKVVCGIVVISSWNVCVDTGNAPWGHASQATQPKSINVHILSVKK